MSLLLSHPAMSNSLWPHRLIAAQVSSPLSISQFCPNSGPLHQWCHLAISSSDALFSFCPPSFPASGTFLVSWLFVSNDQITWALASESVFPTSIQDWFPLRLTGLISLLSKGLLGVFSSTIVWRHQFFGTLPSLRSNSHNRTWPMGRLDCMDLCWQSSVLLCHSVPAKKQTSDSMAAVTIHSDVRGQKGEICHYCHLFHLYLPWS